MSVLIAGLLLFFGIHVLTSTPLRNWAVTAIGENPYKGFFSLLSLAGLGLMVWGFGLSRYGPDSARIIFNPPSWGYYLTPILVFIGLVLIFSNGGKGKLRAVFKQPMSFGVLFWALGHLFSNGNLNEVLLFGSFAAYAVFDIIVSSIKGKATAFEPDIKRDVIAIAVAIVVFAVVIYFHFNLFGVLAI